MIMFIQKKGYTYIIYKKITYKTSKREAKMDMVSFGAPSGNQEVS